MEYTLKYHILTWVRVDKNEGLHNAPYSCSCFSTRTSYRLPFDPTESEIQRISSRGSGKKLSSNAAILAQWCTEFTQNHAISIYSGTAPFGIFVALKRIALLLQR